MATSNSRALARRPAKDEWGVYDPQQAGLAALFARLDNGPAPKPGASTELVGKAEVPEPNRIAIPARPTRDAK